VTYSYVLVSWFNVHRSIRSQETLHPVNVCFGEDKYFKAELAQFSINYKLGELLEYKILSK